MKKVYITLLLLGFLSQTGFAQEFDKAKLDNYFSALEQNNKFMGSVAVSKDGKLIYSNAIGFSDFENQVKANENSIYRIGSISKTFTSVLVLKAVEQGKLKLNQTIDKYFPSIENADKITIEHLLTHRSGIHNFTDDAEYLTYHTQAKSEREMIKIIEKAGSDFEPDTQASYSNSNYVLLSYILEKAFQKSYAAVLTEYISKPLNLKNTYFGGKINPAKNESKSYSLIETWKVEQETDTSIPLGAGAIVSTPSDLVKFSNALFGGNVLKPKSLERMKNLKGPYGMGLIQVPFNDKFGYGHTGGIDGFRSVLFHFGDGNISYAMTSNGSNYETNNISIAVLSAVYGQAYDIPEFSTYEVSSEDLDSYLGVYATEQIPLKLTITKEGKTLIAQGTDQPSFPLEATDKHKFKFEQAGVVLEFNPKENTMILKQGGGEFLFNKQ